MNNLKIFSSVLLFSAVTVQAIAQQAALDTIKTRFEQYNRQRLQEKLFLHTDKEVYLAGEIMWFKIYYTDADTHKPLNLSKAANVELLDKDLKPVLQTKIKLKSDGGNGSLYLPDSIPSGNYLIRAYTNWMKNFNPDFYFSKTVTIVNTLHEITTAAQARKPAYDIRFFPEGGNLVNGLPGKVAFRAIDQNGHGIAFKGALIDQQNDTLVRFNPLKFGIGTFNFTPQAGKTYKAIIKLANGKIIRQEMPQAYAEGYVIHLEESGEQLRLLVETNKIRSALVYLFVHTRQQVKVSAAQKIDNGKAEFLIDKKALGDGISHFTVFDDERRPVCERLYFKRPQQKLLIKSSSSQQNYASRTKVSVEITGQDENENPAPANLSVSVFRADSINSSNQADIFSYLFLNSDLRGSIESPSWYLNNENAETDSALDNLMLTHGWRRFKWEEIFKQDKPEFKFLPEFEGPIVTGTITDTRSNSPAANILTYLSVPGKGVQLFPAKSDNKGQIRFLTKDFYGPSELVLQTDFRTDSTYQIDLNSPFSNQFGTSPVAEFNLSKSMEEDLKSENIAMQVHNIYLKDSLEKFIKPVIAYHSFYGAPDNTYLLDNYTRFTTMEEVFREYVPEIDAGVRKNELVLKVLNVPEKNFFSNPMVLVDGVPVFDSETKIKNYDPLKLQKLEVVARKYFLGPLTMNGIASLTTYKGDLNGLSLNPHAAVIDYDGLQLEREFYSPDYNSDEKISSPVPDFRNVLYWSPSVKTDKNGKAQISFYTSDETGNYRVVIQGLSADGRAGSTSFTFNVNPENL